MSRPFSSRSSASAGSFVRVNGKIRAREVRVIGVDGKQLGILSLQEAINAARANVPMLFSAGRNPITEAGFRGSRNRQIHWAQESFDQGAMVREFVKWDYELRNFAQLETVVDRALAITHAEPQAPVYLTLPREVLAERHDTFEYTDRARQIASSPVVADPAVVHEAARILAGARNPIVITKAAGRDRLAVPALVRFAETLGCGVVEGFATYLNFPRTHPLHAGYDPDPYLDDADVIVALESDAPWFPQIKGPKSDATVIQIGVDPLFSRYPIRGFPGDFSLAGQPRLTLAALADALAPLVDRGAVAARRQRWEAEHHRLREAWAAVARKASTATPIEMSWLSHAIGQAIDDRTIIVNEYDLDPTQAPQTMPGTYFNSPPSSALGWGLGAALGAKLAAPDHTVICPVGDGSYIFGAPTAAHFVSRAYDLPVVWIVCNNRTWNAVKRSTLGYAKDGWAVKTDTMPLTYLEPSPDYEMVCQASGGHGERVEDPAALPAAIGRAVRIARDEKRQVLLNVICRKP